MTLVAIFGPTGCGKTDIAVHTARELGTEVVNCDPAQCYRGFPILTNQPGPQHDAVALHRMIGIWPLTFEASVAAFAERAHTEIDELVAQRGAAVLCGGSGLYLLAALTHLQYGSQTGGIAADDALRQRLHDAYDAEGGPALHARLAQADPAVAARIHPNDRKRLVRALEVVERDGTVAPAGGSIWDAPQRRPGHLAWLRTERTLVRERIDARTRAMFAGGLLDEVAGVVGADGAGIADLSVTARRLHGLQDCVDVLSGACSMEEGLERMAARTRQYARRQDTWARRWPAAEPLDVDLASFDAARIGTLLAQRAQATVEAVKQA